MSCERLYIRERAIVSEATFGLTADVKEAHQQVPIHWNDWHLLGYPLERGREVFVNTVGDIRSILCFLLVEQGASIDWPYRAVLHPTLRHDMAHAVGGRLPPRSRWFALSLVLLVFVLLCDVVSCPLFGAGLREEPPRTG